MTRVQRVWYAAGFTIVELMMAMAVIGIVSSVTAVNVVRQIPRYRLTNAASQLAWTCRGLRMRAISQHHAVQVTFTSSLVYTVWTDLNDNGTIDGGEVQTIDFNVSYPGVTFESTASPTFNFTGTVSNLPTITLTNSSGSKRLTMNILGDVTVQ